MLPVEKRLEAWHCRKYGVVRPAATYRKLLEEVGELGEAMMMADSAACEEEIGDVVAVLCHLLRTTVGGRCSILDALEGAVKKVEAKEAAEAAKEENCDWDLQMWLVDGSSYTAADLCDAALEYGYAGDDPETAAKVLKAWGYEVEAPSNQAGEGKED